MLWVTSVMAAALGQVPIRVRNWAIAAAARGVSIVVGASIMKKHAFQSFQGKRTSKDYATGTAVGIHARSLRRNWGTRRGAGHCGAALVLSQCERAFST